MLCQLFECIEIAYIRNSLHGDDVTRRSIIRTHTQNQHTGEHHAHTEWSTNCVERVGHAPIPVSHRGGTIDCQLVASQYWPYIEQVAHFIQSPKLFSAIILVDFFFLWLLFLYFAIGFEVCCFVLLNDLPTTRFVKWFGLYKMICC